jgi:hypothetical protein|tara:strand:- start:1839 stop:1943 length:105 start_codon:yes stop_codon:yes gene_type:complete
MPAGKGTYGKKRGRPPGKCKKCGKLRKNCKCRKY